MPKILFYATGTAVLAVLLWVLAPSEDDKSGASPDTAGSTGQNSPGAASQGINSRHVQTPTQQSRITGADRGVDSSSAYDQSNVPGPIAGHDRQLPATAYLWQVAGGSGAADADGFPATRLKTDPGLLGQFHVGQELIIDIPDLVQPVLARLESTHNQLDSVQVFRGPILHRDDSDNVIISRGESATYVIVSTSESVWSAVIDHRTGEALLSDERDILARQRHPDMIPVPGYELEPPDQSQAIN